MTDQKPPSITIPVDKFRKFCELARTVNDTIVIVPEETGWRVQSMDITRTSMVYITLPSTIFTSYEQFDPLSFDLPKILSYLKNYHGDITIIPGDGRMTLYDSRMTSTYATLPVEEFVLRDPKVLPRAEFLVSAQDITPIFGTEESSTVDFYLSPDQLRLETKDDQNMGSTYLPPNVTVMEYPEDTTSLRTLIPRKILNQIFKVIPPQTPLTFKSDDDLPMIFSFDLDGVECKYLIAPWIVDE